MLNMKKAFILFLLLLPVISLASPSLTVYSPQNTSYHQSYIPINFTSSETVNMTIYLDGRVIAESECHEISVNSTHNETVCHYTNIRSYSNNLYVLNGSYCLNITVYNQDGSASQVVCFTKTLPEGHINVTTCGILASPDVYLLQNDIIDSSEEKCIDIQSDDVVFDCQGHLIDGTYGGSGIYVESGYDNITVKNCMVKEWWNGIYIGLSDSRIINSIFSGNGIAVVPTGSCQIIDSILKESIQYDLYPFVPCDKYLENVTGTKNRPIGFYNYSVTLENEIYSELILCDADHSTLKNVTVSSYWNNGLFVIMTDHSNFSQIHSSSNIYGIYVDSSTGIQIMDSVFSGNHEHGIYFSHSTVSRVVNSTSSGNRAGISLDDSHDIQVINSTFNSNAIGLEFRGDSSNNQIINSTFNDNSNGGEIRDSSNNQIINSTFNDNNNYGIYAEFLYNSEIVNSTFNNNNRRGLHLFYSNNITFSGNVFQDNGECGVFISHSHSNKFYNNLFNNTQNVYFEGTVYPNYWNTTRQAGTRVYSAGDEIGGNYWTNPSGTGYSDTCEDSDKDGFCDEPYVLATDNVDYLPYSDEYAPPAPAPTPAQAFMPVITLMVVLSGLYNIARYFLGTPLTLKDLVTSLVWTAVLAYTLAFAISTLAG